ncbi:MAG: hypothetical protein ACLQVG_24760 [Terriglobia bacterium]
MSPENRVTPRTFYLSEEHELARGEREGGGRIPAYTDINWAAKGATISRSLHRARTQIQGSTDPARENHYFLIAAPVRELAKRSTDKRKAKNGKVFETTDFAERHSRVFRRLGIDLLNVAENGSAVVHMKPELMAQLSNTAQTLRGLGDREKSRWATIDRFEVIPPNFRIDDDWLAALRPRTITEAVIEFQPLLTRPEIDSLIRAVVALLLRDLSEAVTGTGTDFSGRQWVRGKITPESLTKISQAFFSIQALHSPLVSTTARTPGIKPTGRASAAIEIDTSRLPVIGLVDTGVPMDHMLLSRYRRGTYVAPTASTTPADSHGCFVSSRIVFGDPDFDAGPPEKTPLGAARYYDIKVNGIRPGEIDDKGIYPALQAVVATAPDVRVFNMSFDGDPLDQIGPVKRSQALDLV